MKYKAEIVKNGKVYKNMFFKDLSHPNQVVRNIVQTMKGKIDSYIIVVVNDVGEVWRYSVMKQINGKIFVRKMSNTMKKSFFTRDEIDMIFTGNMSIIGGFSNE